MRRRSTVLAFGAGVWVLIGTLAFAQESKPDPPSESSAASETAPAAASEEGVAPASGATPPPVRVAKTTPAQPKADTEAETPVPILSKIKAATEETDSLTLIGRSDGPVFIVERDGSAWEANRRQLTFYNRATPRVLETSRVNAEEAAAAVERAAELLKQRAEEKAKEDKAKADAKQAAKERAAEEKNAADKAKEKEEKIVSNYVNKEYKYGPNSASEGEEGKTTTKSK